MNQRLKVYRKLEKLLSKKGITFYRLSQETGIPTATFSEWKKGTYMPKIDKLMLIADYLGISVNELIK